MNRRIVIPVLAAVFALVALAIGYRGFVSHTVMPQLLAESVRKLGLPLERVRVRGDRLTGHVGAADSDELTVLSAVGESDSWLFPSRAYLKSITLQGFGALNLAPAVPPELAAGELVIELRDENGDLVRRDVIRDNGKFWSRSENGTEYSGWRDPETGLELINFSGSAAELARPVDGRPAIYTGFPPELKLIMSDSRLSGSALYDPEKRRFDTVKYRLDFREQDILEIGGRRLRGLGRGTMELDLFADPTWRLHLSDALTGFPVRGRLEDVSLIKSGAEQLDFDFTMEFYHGAFKKLLGVEQSLRSGPALHRFIGKFSTADGTWELARVNLDNDTMLNSPLKFQLDSTELSLTPTEFKIFGYGDLRTAEFEYDAALGAGTISTATGMEMNALDGRLQGVWKLPVLGDLASAELSGSLTFALADGKAAGRGFSSRKLRLDYRYYPGAERGKLSLNCAGLTVKDNAGATLDFDGISAEARFIGKPRSSEYSGTLSSRRVNCVFDRSHTVQLDGFTVEGGFSLNSGGLDRLQLQTGAQAAHGSSGLLELSGSGGRGSIFLLDTPEGGKTVRGNLTFSQLILSQGMLAFALSDARCVLVDAEKTDSSMLLIDAPATRIDAPAWNLGGSGGAAVCNLIWDRMDGKIVENDCFARFNLLELRRGDSTLKIPQLAVRYRSDPGGDSHAEISGTGKGEFSGSPAVPVTFKLPFEIKNDGKLTDGSVSCNQMILTGISGVWPDFMVESLENDGMGFTGVSVTFPTAANGEIGLSGHGSGSFHLSGPGDQRRIEFAAIAGEEACRLTRLAPGSLHGSVNLSGAFDFSGWLNPRKSWTITGDDVRLRLGDLAGRAEANDRRNLAAFTLTALEDFRAKSFTLERRDDGSLELECSGHAARLLPFDYDPDSRSFVRVPDDRAAFGMEVSLKMHYAPAAAE